MKMMKKAGFTLVELIVVITILAILGTIAFISLQGNTQDAKNSTVVSELRTIITAIETVKAKDDIPFSAIYSARPSSGTGNEVVGTAFSGVTLTGSLNYNVGAINFAALKQNADGFKDPEGRDYIYAYAANGNDAYYQVAGEVMEASGNRKQYVQGLYLTGTGSDVAGLISLANP